MAFAYKLKTRNLFSTWFSLFFFLLLLSYLGFIELFQDSQGDAESLDLLTNPVKLERLSQMTKINFKNRLGEFSATKEKGTWMLQKPRVIPAKKETVDAIFRTLGNLKVQTVHELEPLNLRSFSLDKPLIDIDFSSEQDSMNVKIGLINSINNTSYILISGNNQIYQTTTLDFAFESLALSDFVDAGVFSMKLSEIKRFTLYQGKNFSPNNVLERTTSGWISKKYNSITNKNVEEKIQSYLDINTHMIVDRMNNELETFINNYLTSALYRIVIQTNSGKKITYKVTSLIKEVKELRLESRQYFIMSASDRPFPFIVPKSYIDRIFIRYGDLK